MVVLTHEQVAFILNDIRRSGIETEELQLNLLDHICCIVEDELLPNHSFEECYQSVMPRFFKRELYEIQEETNLLLTFKHYYAMKKVMLISGTFSAVGFIIGSFFKLMHWPGAGAMLMLAVFCMSVLFLPLLCVLKIQEAATTRNKLIIGVATVFGILISTGAVFKVQHWPGANVLWWGALELLVFVFLPIYFFTGIRNADTKTNTIITSILILGAAGVLFLPFNTRQNQWNETVYLSANKYLNETYAYTTNANTQKYVSNTANATNNAALQKASNDLCAQIDKLKYFVIDGTTNNTQPRPTEVEFLRERNGNYDIPTSLLFANGINTPAPQLTALKTALQNYATLVKTTYNVHDVALLSIENTTQVIDGQKVDFTWESKFYHAPFELVFRHLSELQLNVRIIEANAIR
ncbi:MAG: hypothetical protein ABL940_00290 [Bacteroidia bacterium]